MSWTTKQLGEVAEVVRGISYKSSEIVATGGVPMVNLKNVSKGGGFRTEGTKHFTGTYKPTQVLREGDLLVAATDLSKAKDVLGSPFVVPDSLTGAVFSLDLVKIEPDPQSVDPRYLYYFLRSPNARFFTKSIGRGITVMHMSSREFPKLDVPVPPLDEQRRIVAELEEQLGHLKATRTRLDKTRSELLNLRASALNNHFGDPSFYENDESVSLGEILQPILGKRKTQRGWSPQCESYPAVDGHWGVLKTTAVQMGWYEPGQNKALPSHLEPRPVVEVQVGDLLLLTTGPRNRCGIPALVEETPRNLMMSGKMIRLRSDRTRVLSEWLLLFFLSPRGQSELERLKVGSSDSSVSIGADVLLRIQIPGVALDEQEQLVTEMTYLAEAQRRIEKLSGELEDQLETARSSILHRAFSPPREDL